MKKFCLLLIPILFLTGCTKEEVLLKTDIKEAEALLQETVKLYYPTLFMRSKEPERHIYVIGYNWEQSTTAQATNININIDSPNTEIQNDTSGGGGGFSCVFKELKGNNTLVRCRTIYPVNAYIYNHYKKYFKELKHRGVKYISYDDFLEMKEENEL